LISVPNLRTRPAALISIDVLTPLLSALLTEYQARRTIRLKIENRKNTASFTRLFPP
jgi:hypothetical protein